MDQNSSQEPINTAEQLNFIIRRVPKHSTTKLVFENLQITTLLEPVNSQLSLIRALKAFTALQLLDLSSNNLNLLMPTSQPHADLLVQLTTIISVNLSDNPISNVQKTIEQLQNVMPNVTDLQISLYKEEDVDYIITRMPQLEYLNNLPIERDSTQLSKLQLEIGETPSSLEGVTSFAVGSVPDEFDEGLSAVSQVTSLPSNAKMTNGGTRKSSGPNQIGGDMEETKYNALGMATPTHKFESMQRRVGQTILLTNASNKSKSKIKKTMLQTADTNKFRVAIDSKLPVQPNAEMTSVNLLETSENTDNSSTRNGFQNFAPHSEEQQQNEGSFEQVCSAKFGEKPSYRSPEKASKESQNKNVYISPSSLSRMTPDNKVQAFDQKTMSACEMNEPVNAATQESYLRQVENSAPGSHQMSAKSLNNNQNNFTLNKDPYKNMSGVHTTVSHIPGVTLGKSAKTIDPDASQVSYKSKDTICLGTSQGSQRNNKSGVVIVQGHSRTSSADNKPFAGQSEIPAEPAIIPVLGSDQNSIMPGSNSDCNHSIHSSQFATPYTQMRGRLNLALQSGSRLSTQTTQKSTASLTKVDVDELKGLFQKIRNYRLEKVLSPKGGIGQQQISESETMMADSKLAKEFDSHLKTVTKSLEYRLNQSVNLRKSSKNFSQSSALTQGMSQADRQIEVLKSKFFLLDVLFEKAVENLRFNPTLTKSRQKDKADQEIVSILTQVRQSMCQTFVNLAKQQATVAQDVDDVKDLYETELQQRNDDVMKMMDELKTTSYELTKCQKQLEDMKLQGTGREEQLEQQVVKLEKDLKAMLQDSDKRDQRFKQELGEQQIIVEEHKTMLTEHEMTITDYTKHLNDNKNTLKDMQVTINDLQADLKQTENEKALEREDFNARRQALAQQLQQTQKEFDLAREEIKTITSLLEGSKMFAENLQQQLDETKHQSTKKVEKLQKQLDEMQMFSSVNSDKHKFQLDEHRNLSNKRFTETQVLHDRECDMLHQKTGELKRCLEIKCEEMMELARSKNKDIAELKLHKSEKISTLRQKNQEEVAELKQKISQELHQMKSVHNEEVTALKQQMCNELDELKVKQREDIWELKLMAKQDAESQKLKAVNDTNEIRQQANSEIVEVKQRTIDDLNQLKVKASKENDQLLKRLNEIDEENLVLTEKNVELTQQTGRFDQIKKEYTSYKNDAEHMIEDLHSENSKQTELIVKHSIMMADRQTKLRHKLTQTDEVGMSDIKKGLTKKGSQQRLSISSYYDTNPRNNQKIAVKTKAIDLSVPISNMNSNMVASVERLPTSQADESASASSIRLNLKQFSQRRSRKQRGTEGTSPHNFRPNSHSQTNMGKVPFAVNNGPRQIQQANAGSFSSLTRALKSNNKNNPVSPIRQSHEIITKSPFQHISGAKTPIATGTPISPSSQTISNQLASTSLEGTQNLGNMSARPKNNKTIGHGLTLRQTKELIHELFISKRKSDEQCIAKKQARETMEQHMYTYLNQRYGLKQLIVDWAAALIGAIKHFSPVDHEVNLYGKILKNSIDEEFWLVQLHVKATIQSLVRQQVREKNASKQAKHIAEISSDILSDRVRVEQAMWMKIIDRMYEDKDVVVLKQKIIEKAQACHLAELERKKEATENPNQRYGGSRSRDRNDKRASSRGNRSGSVSTPISYRAQPNSSANLAPPTVDLSTQLVLSDLVKVIQDFQLQEHENFLSNFMRLFRAQDSDRDGILNPLQFSALLVSMNIGITQKQTDAFLQQLDPFCTEQIPLSDVIQLLSNQQTTVKQLQQIQESSSWQETSKNVETIDNKHSVILSGEQGQSPLKLSRISLMQPTQSVSMEIPLSMREVESSDNSLVVVSSRKEEQFGGMLSSTHEIVSTLQGRLL